MEYLGLALEILFFLIGLYLYLFSRGALKVKDPVLREKAEKFRQSNGLILRLLGLGLMAVMGLNIFLHLAQWGGQ